MPNIPSWRCEIKLSAMFILSLRDEMSDECMRIILTGIYLAIPVYVSGSDVLKVLGTLGQHAVEAQWKFRSRFDGCTWVSQGGHSCGFHGALRLVGAC